MANPQLNVSEYHTLGQFVAQVPKRVWDRRMTVEEDRAALMHPLTAWDKGKPTEFASWMDLKREQ